MIRISLIAAIIMVSGNLIGMQQNIIITELLLRINETKITRTPPIRFDDIRVQGQLEKMTYTASYELPESHHHITYLMVHDRNTVTNNCNFYGVRTERIIGSTPDTHDEIEIDDLSSAKILFDALHKRYQELHPNEMDTTEI